MVASSCTVTVLRDGRGECECGEDGRGECVCGEDGRGECECGEDGRGECSETAGVSVNRWQG